MNSQNEIPLNSGIGTLRLNPSNIAHFREQQSHQEAAARAGLSGPAIVGSHESIEARAQCQAERLLRLLKAGKHEEVARQMNLDDWGEKEAGAESHTLTE